MTIDRDRIYLFDEFVLEPRRGTLRGPAGADFGLRPKAYSLLVHLLDNPGRLLERQALLNALWPDVAVTDDSLTQCVSDLRHALGARASHVLRTVPRRGYVLTAKVRRADVEPAMIPKQVAVSTDRNAAVLVEPFAHTDDLPSSRLARMLHSELVTELTLFEDIRVVSMASEEASWALRVCGEVWTVDPGPRVSLRLLSSGGTSLWASKISFRQNDGSELEAQLRKLSFDLVKEVNRISLRQARDMPDADLTTGHLLLMGQDLLHRVTKADTLAAISFLERAVSMDPEFAIAIAQLAFLVQRSATFGWGHLNLESAQDLSLELARRAVQLEPSSPSCLAPLASALMVQGRWEEAVTTARAVVTTDRRNAHNIEVLAAVVLSLAGVQDEAIEIVRGVMQLDQACPPTFHGVLGRALLLAGDLEKALKELRLCAAHLPDYAPGQQCLVVAATEAGRPEEAQAALQEVFRLNPAWTMERPDESWLLRRPADQQRFLAAFRKTAAEERSRQGR